MDTSQLITLIVAAVGAIASIIAAVIAAKSSSGLKKLEAEIARRAKLDDKFSDFVLSAQSILSGSLEKHHRFLDDVKYYHWCHIEDLRMLEMATQSEEATTLVLPNGEALESQLRNLSLKTLGAQYLKEQADLRSFYYKSVIPSSIYILNEIRFLWFYVKLGSNFAPIVNTRFSKKGSPGFLLFDLFEEVMCAESKLIEIEMQVLHEISQDEKNKIFDDFDIPERSKCITEYTSAIIRFNAYISSKIHPA